MLLKNAEGLQEYAEQVEAARKRYDAARVAAENAAVELHEARAAVDAAEDRFMGFAWGAFGLPTPLDRYIGNAGRPASAV